MRRCTACLIPRRWQSISLIPLLLGVLLCVHPLHAQDPVPGAPAPLYLPLVANSVPDPVEPVFIEPLPIDPSAVDATRKSYLPLVLHAPSGVARAVATVPVSGPPVDRPAAVNGDLNLALRGYVRTSAALRLLDLGGETDSDPPQLARLFAPPRRPTLTTAYRVHDWNWACGANGCRGAPIASPPVTLLGMGTRLGEPLHVPGRRAQIYTGGYVVLVLYADETRITLKYTREDSPVYGYMVHVEGFAVEPWLLVRYRELNAGGRRALPALRSGDLIGWATGPEVKVAVRDTGSFMEPRSRKDWWQGW